MDDLRWCLRWCACVPNNLFPVRGLLHLKNVRCTVLPHLDQLWPGIDGRTPLKAAAPPAQFSSRFPCNLCWKVDLASKPAPIRFQLADPPSAEHSCICIAWVRGTTPTQPPPPPCLPLVPRLGVQPVSVIHVQLKDAGRPYLREFTVAAHALQGGHHGPGLKARPRPQSAPFRSLAHPAQPSPIAQPPPPSHFLTSVSYDR